MNADDFRLKIYAMLEGIVFSFLLGIWVYALKWDVDPASRLFWVSGICWASFTGMKILSLAVDVNKK